MAKPSLAIDEPIKRIKMKALFITFAILLSGFNVNAGTSQILSQQINPEHLDPADFRGGTIKFANEQIKLSLFVTSEDQDIEELSFVANVVSSTVNECNDKIYRALTDKNNVIILTDRSEQTCDEVVLFPVIASYTTVDSDTQPTSVFKGSNFVSFNNPTGQIKLGTTISFNLGSPNLVNTNYKNATQNRTDLD